MFVAYWQALENECQKKCPETFLQTQHIRTYNWFYRYIHNVQIRSFILDINNNFSPQCIIIQQFYQIFSQSLSHNMYWLKKTKGNVLLFLIISLKINHQNVSCPTFDIHKSKLLVAKWHFIKLGKTYNYFFSTNPSNNSLEFFLIETKTIFGHKCILNLFNHLFSTNCKRRWFLTIKRFKNFQKFFILHMIFFKKFISSKNIRYGV
jgi:hypothetical protein